MNKKLASQVSRILEPSQEQKERMLHGIFECRAERHSKGKSFGQGKRFHRALAAVVAACFLITTTAVAAEYMGLEIGFLDFLKPSGQEQEEYLAQGAYTINKTVSSAGCEVTVKQVIGDSCLVYILMDIAAPEGTVFDKARYNFEDFEFDAGQEFSNASVRTVEVPNRKDRVSLVLGVMTNQTLMGKTAHLKLKDLQAADAFPSAFETISPGEWEFSFPLDFQQYSEEREAHVPVSIEGYPAEIHSVSVSPISVSLKVESAFAKEISEKRPALGESTGPNEYVDAYPVTIHYQDGTSETTRLFAGMYKADYYAEEIFIIKTFQNVINEKEISSVSFFDAEILLGRR